MQIAWPLWVHVSSGALLKCTATITQAVVGSQTQWCRRRGCRGASAPSKIWFVENLGKIPENLGKTSKNLGKIPEKLGKNGAQHCLTTKNAPIVFWKTQLRPFFRGHTKNRSSCSLWEKICGQKVYKNFRASLGKYWQKSFTPPKICLLLHLSSDPSIRNRRF